MNKKWICTTVLVIALVGVLIPAGQLPQSAKIDVFQNTPLQLEENETKYYNMTQLGVGSTPNPDPMYQGCVFKATNGNLVAGGYTSTNNGSTWTSKWLSNANGWFGFYATGNTIYVVFLKDNGWWAAGKSTDGGATYAQLGNDICDYTGGPNFAIGICYDGVDVVAFFSSGATPTCTLTAYTYNSGTGNWGVDATLAPTAGEGYLPTIHTTYYDGVETCVYFCVMNHKNADNSKIYTILMKWVSGAITIEKAFNSINGDGDNLRTEYDKDSPISIWGSDHFTKLDNGYYYLSGMIYSDAGTFVNNTLLRTNDASGTWEIIANERLLVSQGTLPRVWAVTRGGGKVYLSHNGVYFFPVSYNASRTWVGIIEISNSDRGAMAFNSVANVMICYTMQEETWNDLFTEESLKLYAGSEPGIFKGVMDAADKTRFVDGMVIPIFDNSGNILFEGKVAFTEQDEGLYALQAVEISEELERIKPTGTYTAQTAAQILVAMINAGCTFCYQNSSIVSSATTYTIQFKGEKSLAQILDEFAHLEDYIWYKAGDGKIIFDDGTTASGVTYDASTDAFAEPKITSEGYRIANRIEGRGKVEADGPVFYAADDLDDQTRNGVWVHKFTQPTWGYAEVAAFADNLLAARKSWSDIFSMLVEETLTLRPGTTVGMSNFSTEFGIDDGTYIIMAIEHNGEDITKLILNNSAISSKDWAREQEYANNAMKDLYTKSDITESGAASTEIPMEAEDEMLARIIRHATSEANAITVIYDSTHSAKMWVDSSGNWQSRIVANAAWNFEQTSGNALVYIKASGGAGTEDAWLFLDAEDDSAILFQENGVTKGYVSWNKGNAELEIYTSVGDIVLNPNGLVKITKSLSLPLLRHDQMGGINGVSQYATYWVVAHSDTDAQFWAEWFNVPAGTYRLRLSTASDSIATDSGTLSIFRWPRNGALTALVGGANFDIAHAAANTLYDKNDTNDLTITEGDIVIAIWVKDDNAGGAAGNVIVHCFQLVRQ